MRNFNYDDNEDFQNEVDGFFEDEEFDDIDFEGGEFYSSKSVLQAMQMELMGANLDVKLLKVALKVASDTWFWRFFSLRTKVRMIVKSYVAFSKLLEEGEENKKRGKKEE